MGIKNSAPKSATVATYPTIVALRKVLILYKRKSSKGSLTTNNSTMAKADNASTPTTNMMMVSGLDQPLVSAVDAAKSTEPKPMAENVRPSGSNLGLIGRFSLRKKRDPKVTPKIP